MDSDDMPTVLISNDMSPELAVDVSIALPPPSPTIPSASHVAAVATATVSVGECR